jgi:hypothetical protein
MDMLDLCFYVYFLHFYNFMNNKRKTRKNELSNYYKDPPNGKRISENGFHHERPQRWMVREKKPGHLYFQKKTREQSRNISGRLFSHFYCQ